MSLRRFSRVAATIALVLSASASRHVSAQAPACGFIYAACDTFAEPPRDPTMACPATGSVVVLGTGRHVLRTDCDYRNVRFVIRSANTTLDCNGADLEFVPSSDEALRTQSAIRIEPPSVGAPPPTCVEVRDCHVIHWNRGVNIARGLSPEESEDLRSLYATHSADPELRDSLVRQYEDELRSTAPAGVLLRHVNVEDPAHVGIYLHRYVHDVTIVDSAVTDSGTNTAPAPAVYLDSGSQSNSIVCSGFHRSSREAIAVDSSAHNEIRRSHFYGNHQGGIFLYKNAWEQACRSDGTMPEPSVPRSQHASDNTIVENVFVDIDCPAGPCVSTGPAVWVAARASRDYSGYSGMTHLDPVAYATGSCGAQVWTESCSDCTGVLHYRDFAESNYILDNQFLIPGPAVRVEDDLVDVWDNDFEWVDARSVAIEIGSQVRGLVADPIGGTDVRGNTFDGPFVEPIRTTHCAHTTVWYGNDARDGSALVTYVPDYVPAAAECSVTAVPLPVHLIASSVW